MSIKVRDLVTDRSLAKRPAELLVLQTIADFAHDDGTGAWPGQDKIAALCRISVRYVGELIKAAVERGELIVRYRAHGSYGTNLYQINVAQLAKQPSISEQVNERRASRRANPTEHQDRRVSRQKSRVTTDMHEPGYPHVHEAGFAQSTNNGSPSDGTVVPTVAEPEYLRSIIEPPIDPSVDPSGHRAPDTFVYDPMNDSIDEIEDAGFGTPPVDDIGELSPTAGETPHGDQDLQATDRLATTGEVSVQAASPAPEVIDYDAFLSDAFGDLWSVVRGWPDQKQVVREAAKMTIHLYGGSADEDKVAREEIVKSIYYTYLDCLSKVDVTRFIEVHRAAYECVFGASKQSGFLKAYREAYSFRTDQPGSLKESLRALRELTWQMVLPSSGSPLLRPWSSRNE